MPARHYEFYLRVFNSISHTNDVFDNFPKIFQKLSEGQTNVSDHFPKITVDFRGRTDNVSIIEQQIKGIMQP